MKTFLSNNIKHLRIRSGQSQGAIGSQLAKAHTSIGNWEKGIAEPSLLEIQELARIFDVDPRDLIFSDLSKGEDAETRPARKIDKKPEDSGEDSGEDSPNAGVKSPKLRGKREVNVEPVTFANGELKQIPIVDISVAAGSGYINPAHIEHQGHIAVPASMLGKGMHLAVRNKGQSMEPTLPDGSLLIIRLIEPSQWQDMRDEEIYVISARTGESWVKTVKNRLKEYGFLVLMSENPDKNAYGNFNVENHEIQSVWHVDCALQFRFKSAYRQYFDRLKSLEDVVEELVQHTKLKPKKRVYKLDS